MHREFLIQFEDEASIDKRAPRPGQTAARGLGVTGTVTLV